MSSALGLVQRRTPLAALGRRSERGSADPVARVVRVAYVDYVECCGQRLYCPRRPENVTPYFYSEIYWPFSRKHSPSPPHIWHFGVKQ